MRSTAFVGTCPAWPACIGVLYGAAAAQCQGEYSPGWRIIVASDREEFMFPRHWLRAFACALCAATLCAVAFAQSASTPANKVVMQVSDGDPGKWNLALNNARNLQADLGAKNVEIEIVAYGPGIGMLKSDSTVGNRIGEAV